MNKSKKIDLENNRILEWDIDKELLLEALTHPNFHHSEHPTENFERLEFLGDSILDTLTAEWLYKETNEDVGILSQLRSLLVRTNTLAEVGKELGIAKNLRTEPNYRIVETDLEDSLEAIFGAFYLSKGVDITRDFFYKLFLKRLQHFKNEINDEKGREKILKLTVCELNPINQLQEFFQKEGLEVPEYSLLTKKGEDHDPIFFMQCRVKIADKEYLSSGKGPNRKSAKRAAAEKMIKKLKI
jgi:ribonuclease-3